jgi:PilZ domain
MWNRRRQPRQLTLKTGKIHSRDIPSEIDCAILDISDEGARILLPAGVKLSDTFDLTVDPQGESYFCRVAWQLQNKIGVCFKRRHGHE